MSWVAHRVQVAEASSGKSKVQFSEKILKFSLFKIGPAHLEKPGHRRSAILSCDCSVTRVPPVVFYSTEHVIVQYL